MTIARSHGKSRSELPRSRDLPAIESARDRNAFRGEHGRFGAGNGISRGRGWKRATLRLLGRDAALDAPEAARVVEDAYKIFRESLAELPHDGVTVRELVARKARHAALESFWSARAIAQIGTPEGIEAEERATLHGQRAERLAVTALDIASRLVAARPAPATWPTWTPPPRDDGQRDQDDEHHSPGEDAPGLRDCDADGPEAIEPDPPVPEAPAPSPMVREPMSQAEVHDALLSRVTQPARTGLCPHQLNPQNCLQCFGQRQAAQHRAAAGGKPWRSLLPKDHPSYRGPR